MDDSVYINGMKFGKPELETISESIAGFKEFASMANSHGTFGGSWSDAKNWTQVGAATGYEDDDVKYQCPHCESYDLLWRREIKSARCVGCNELSPESKLIRTYHGKRIDRWPI